MSIITDGHLSDRRGTQRLRNIYIAIAVLGSLFYVDPAPAAESGADNRPMLRVPVTDSTPVVDGKLDEACWKDAAKTGPLKVTQGEPAKSTTEAFILRDADHLYVGVSTHTQVFACNTVLDIAGGEVDAVTSPDL